MEVTCRVRWWVCLLGPIVLAISCHGQASGADKAVECAIFRANSAGWVLDLNRFKNLSSDAVRQSNDSDVIQLSSRMSIVCLYAHATSSSSWRKTGQKKDIAVSSKEACGGEERVFVVENSITGGKRNSTLVICGSTLQDGSNYVFTAGNNSKTIKLFVFLQLKNPFSGSMSKTKGDDLALSCKADSVPPPSFSWLFDNKPLVNGSRQGNIVIVEGAGTSDLTAKNLDYSDRGHYVCSVKSFRPDGELLSSAKASVLVRVRDPLGALWPVLGIFGQCILLAAIILCDEKRKKARSSFQNRADSFNNSSVRSTGDEDNATLKPSSGTARYSKNPLRREVSSGGEPLMDGKESPNVDDLRCRTVSV